MSFDAQTKKSPLHSDNCGSIKEENLIDSSIAVKFSDVTKTYHLYKNDRGRFLGLFGIKKAGLYLGELNANESLSFEIKKGEAVAFIGENGAGKSTALKIINGVAYPTSGKVYVDGRISALIELNAGFDRKLTGRENIRLRGQVLGLPSDSLAQLESDVLDFIDLGNYIDQPIRTYSSGMKARLGFGIAVSTNPDILIVDEALSVGDRRFKKKCIDKIRKIMRDEAVTVLFVTHSSGMAQEFCSRGIVLNKGRLVYDGPIKDAIRFYESGSEGIDDEG